MCLKPTIYWGSERMVWVVKKYVQSKRSPPRVVKVLKFNTREEAMRFYESHKRAYGWPWVFYSYPEEVPE